MLDLGDGSNSRVTINDNEPSRGTYGLFLTGVSPAATPTDVITLRNPSTSKVMRIRSITMAGTASSASNVIVNLVKRSTANTGGTSTTPTGVSRDSNNDASQMAVNLYSANPTALGAALGTIDGARLNLAPAANGGIDRVFFQFSWLNDQALILRPGEMLAINFNGAAWPGGGLLDTALAWSEE